MGCWNTTCGLTHLPIMAGESVVMLMLAGLDTTPNQCYYYNDDASPFALPVEGEYNDYGGLENIQMSDETQHMLATHEFYSHEQGEFKQIETHDVNEILDYLFEHNLYIKYPFVGDIKVRCDYTPILYVMYHKGAYELIRDEIYNRETANNQGAYGLALYSKVKRNWEKNLYARQKTERLMKKFKEENANNAIIPPYLSELYLPSPIWDNLGLGYKFCLTYENLVYENDKLDGERFMQDLVRFACFLTGLDYSRRSFFGLCGMGSQANERYIPKKLAEWTLQHILINMDEDDTENTLRESVYMWN